MTKMLLTLVVLVMAVGALTGCRASGEVGDVHTGVSAAR